MTESAQIAHAYARVFLRDLGESVDFLDRAGVHMHVPEGATPKDGPSAGITMVLLEESKWVQETHKHTGDSWQR